MTPMQRRTRATSASLAIVASLAVGSCTTEPELSTLVVDTVTRGDPTDIDADGYELTGIGGPAVALAASGRTTLPGLTPGSVVVAVSGIAAHCLAQGGDTRTVELPARDTVFLAFTITCGITPATIDVELDTPPGGSINTLMVRVGGKPPVPLLPGITTSLGPLTPGTHTVSLSVDPANCRFAAPAAQTVTVARGERGQVRFTGRCSPGRIAVTRLGRLFVMNADGSDPREITPPGISVSHATLSPDGSRVAFVDGWTTLSVMQSDGSGAAPIATIPNVKTLIWSPDGSRIALSATVGPYYTYEVLVINTDGSGLRNLSNHPARDEDPTWSPDGTRVVFTSDRAGVHYPFDAQLLVVNADGTGTALFADNAYSPSWSPDGSLIAIRSGAGLHVMAPDGTNRRLLNSVPPYTSSPSWSPDSRMIISFDQRDRVHVTSVADNISKIATVPLPYTHISMTSWSR